MKSLRRDAHGHEPCLNVVNTDVLECGEYRCAPGLLASLNLQVGNAHLSSSTSTYTSKNGAQQSLLLSPSVSRPSTVQARMHLLVMNTHSSNTASPWPNMRHLQLTVNGVAAPPLLHPYCTTLSIRVAWHLSHHPLQPSLQCATAWWTTT
eukprot:scaffold276342_cov21-Tisochrysis_lutea.AAC.1